MPKACLLIHYVFDAGCINRRQTQIAKRLQCPIESVIRVCFCSIAAALTAAALNGPRRPALGPVRLAGWTLAAARTGAMPLGRHATETGSAGHCALILRLTLE